MIPQLLADCSVAPHSQYLYSEAKYLTVWRVWAMPLQLRAKEYHARSSGQVECYS